MANRNVLQEYGFLLLLKKQTRDNELRNTLIHLAGKLFSSEKNTFPLDKLSGFEKPIDILDRVGILKVTSKHISFSQEFYYKYSLSFYLVNEVASIVDLKSELGRKRLEKEYYGWSQPLGNLQYLSILILREELKIDIFNWLEGDKNDFWFIYDPITKVLPYIEITTNRLFILLMEIRVKVEEDLAGGAIFESIKELAQTKPKIADSLLALVIGKSKELYPLIPFIFEGLSIVRGIPQTFEQISILIKSTDSEVSQYSLLASSNLKYDLIENSKQLTVLEKVYGKVSYKDSEELQATIVQAYGNISHSLNNIKDRILYFSKSKLPQVQYAVSSLLWRKVKYEADPIWYAKVLSNFSDVKTEYGGIIQNIDRLFLDVVKSSPTLIIDFIKKWICSDNREPQDIKLFDHILTHIYQSHYEEFCLFVSQWLNEDDAKLHLALEVIMSKFYVHGFKKIELSKSYLEDLTSEEHSYMMCKVLGYVLSNEQQRHIFYSFIELDKIEKGFETSIIRTFVFIACNYPSTKDFINDKKQTASRKSKKRIKQIITGINSYFEAHKEIIETKELRPSEARLVQYHKEETKIQNKAYEENMDSPNSLSSFAHQVKLKSSGFWFSKVDGQYSKKSKMGSFQRSFELPRQESIDPISQQKMRIYWRNIRKK